MSPAPTRRALLAGSAALLASACTRYSLPPPGALDADDALAALGARAGVRIATYADDPAREERAAYPFEVHTELWWLGPDGAWELVHRDRNPAWAREDLLPGRYELRVIEASDGERVQPAAGRQRRRFAVRDGERADLALTLRSVPWEALVVVAIVLLVVTVVVVAAVAASGGAPSGGPGAPASGAGGGRGPPIDGRPVVTPHPVVHPGAWPVPAIGLYGPFWSARLLWLPCDVYVYGTPWMLAYEEELLPPEEPPPGPGLADVVTPRPDDPAGLVHVHFTSPMVRGELGPDTLSLVGPEGPVATAVWAAPDGRHARVRPLRPLAPGRWVIRVLGRALHDTAGEALAYDAQVPFVIHGARSAAD